MRILQLCTKVPYPPLDGGAAGVYFFTSAFADLGHQVEVLAVNPPKHFIDEKAYHDLSPSIHIHPVSFDTTPRWYKALKNLLLTNTPYIVERFINKQYTKKLIDLIDLHKPDFIQIEGIYLCPYIPVIRKISNANIVLRAHNVEYILWSDIANNEKNLLKKNYLKIQAFRLKKYEVNQLTKVDGVTTVTENDLQVLKSNLPSIRASVIPFGIPLPSKLSEEKLNLKALYFLGALDWIPNLEALEWFVSIVWPRILQTFPEFEFHIAGRNASRNFISFLKDKRGVIFHGEIPDAATFIKPYTINVVPLFSGSGIRVKIIESMAYGKVVIGSSKAISGISVVPGRHLLFAETAEEYLAHINNLISNTNIIKEISDNAIALVRERFNILAITSELVNFYREIALISK
jgi:glycosyltransferase involved in cell wall biosynthesis